jgi:hypothetical protein
MLKLWMTFLAMAGSLAAQELPFRWDELTAGD